MPVIQVTLIRGYSAETRQVLCTRLTDAAMATIAAPAEAVTVFINEVDGPAYMRGRMGKTPGEAPRPPADLCLDFLDHMGARDLDGARALVSKGFQMIFPGPSVFTNFSDLLDWAAPRYRSIAKTIQRVEEAPMGEVVSVYVSGTLHGERPDGTPFRDIRFIDRFEVCWGVIQRQEVWNDLAESRPFGG